MFQEISSAERDVFDVTFDIFEIWGSDISQIQMELLFLDTGNFTSEWVQLNRKCIELGSKAG